MPPMQSMVCDPLSPLTFSNIHSMQPQTQPQTLPPSGLGFEMTSSSLEDVFSVKPTDTYGNSNSHQRTHSSSSSQVMESHQDEHDSSGDVSHSCRSRRCNADR